VVESPDGHRDVAAPWLGTLFGLEEHEELGHPARTRAIAREADAPVWIGDFDSTSGGTTLEACREFAKPVLLVVRRRTRPSDVGEWIRENNVKVLNVAENRESKSPGIGLRVDLFLGRVFRLLRGEGLADQGER
jgi:hypothetical protein